MKKLLQVRDCVAFRLLGLKGKIARLELGVKRVAMLMLRAKESGPILIGALYKFTGNRRLPQDRKPGPMEGTDKVCRGLLGLIVNGGQYHIRILGERAGWGADLEKNYVSLDRGGRYQAQRRAGTQQYIPRRRVPECCSVPIRRVLRSRPDRPARRERHFQIPPAACP